MPKAYVPSRGQKKSKDVRHSPTRSQKKFTKKKKTKSNNKNYSKLGQLNARFDEIKVEIKRDISTHEFKRDFYCPSKETLEVSTDEISKWIEEQQITIRSGWGSKSQSARRKTKLPDPVLELKHIEWPDSNDITQNLKTRFETPTPIQSVTWPLLLSGLNVIGIAKTGSGKTLAFLLPAIIHMRAQPRCNDPNVLIVLPTRELAVQVYGEPRKFAKGIRSVCLYGGVPEHKQKAHIGMGVDILVATPGRLLDFVITKMISLRKVW